MSKEYNRNKPPNKVFSTVFIQLWYIQQVCSKVANMGLYMALIGLEIEFTKPAGAEAENRDNYQVVRWGYLPQEGYGAGANQNASEAAVQSIEISPDRKKVRLLINPADLEHDNSLPLKSTLFRITISNVKSEQDQEPLWHDRAYYTLNRIGPADRLGCTDSGFEEYDASAVYDDGLQCRTEIVRVKDGLPGEAPGSADFHVHNSGNGVIRIRVPYSGIVRITMRDLKGTVLKEYTGQGPGEFGLGQEKLRKGVVFFQVKVSREIVIKRILL